MTVVASCCRLCPPGYSIPVFRDRKSTRLNSSHQIISYAVFCLKKEEHTSELQSPDHLVCRLLLEKKKKTSRAKPEHSLKNTEPPTISKQFDHASTESPRRYYTQ